MHAGCQLRKLLKTRRPHFQRGSALRIWWRSGSLDEVHFATAECISRKRGQREQGEVEPGVTEAGIVWRAYRPRWAAASHLPGGGIYPGQRTTEGVRVWDCATRDFDLSAIPDQIRKEMDLMGYAMPSAPVVSAWCRKDWLTAPSRRYLKIGLAP